MNATGKLVILLAGFTSALLAEDHWVATWAASPQAARINFPTPARPPAAAPTPAVPPAAGAATTPNPPPIFPAPPTFNNQTVRMIARTSIGGRRVVVHLSNTFGSSPLRIGAAHIALRDKESAIVAASDHALTFSGKPSFTIPAG